jgi:hypothetical protein
MTSRSFSRNEEQKNKNVPYNPSILQYKQNKKDQIALNMHLPCPHLLPLPCSAPKQSVQYSTAEHSIDPPLFLSVETAININRMFDISYTSPSPHPTTPSRYWAVQYNIKSVISQNVFFSPINCINADFRYCSSHNSTSDSSISAFLDAILKERDSFQLFSQLVFNY